MLRRLGCGLVSAILMVVAMKAAPPTIERIEPVGAQRGSAFRLDLYGSNLPSAARILSKLPATFTPLTPRARDAPDLSFLVELEKDAPVGIYPLRLETNSGLSNLWLFSVGEFPDVAEEETHMAGEPDQNGTPGIAQAVSLPSVVNGRLQGADRDVYRFEMRPDEDVTVEVEARRVGSAIDPVLRLLDAEGKQVAINNDAIGLGLDARLRFHSVEGGIYYAVVHDSTYSKQNIDFYRLKIGDFDFADGYFPLGGSRGEYVDVEWFGGSLSEPTTQHVDLADVEAGHRWAEIRTPGKPGALPATFVVSDRDEEFEGKMRDLTAGRVVNGRISAAGEVDRYELAVGGGQSWRIRVDAAGLGSSELYPLLSVYVGEKLLARAGDEIPEKGTTTLEENTFVSRDPYVHLQVPDGTTELTVVVEDLVARGGPGFGYRLLAEQGPADFDLVLDTPHVNIPVGGVAYVRAAAVRQGFAGPIQLKLEETPDGIQVEGGHIAGAILTKDRVGGTSAGTLVLRADPSAALQTMTLRVVGEAVMPNGEVVRRRASGPGLVTAIQSRSGIRARQLPARADWLNADLPARVSASVPARLVVDGPAAARIVKGTEYQLRWKLVVDDPAIKGLSEFRLNTGGARETTFSPRDPEAEMDGSAFTKYLRTTMGGPEQKFDITLSAQVMVGGSEEVLSTPVITLEVVEGFEVKPDDETFSATPGEDFLLAGAIDRDVAFDKEVTVRADDLPRGVSCDAGTTPSGMGRFELACRVAEDADQGLHEVRLTGSSVMAGRGEGKNVPYQVDPVTVTLAVDQP